MFFYSNFTYCNFIESNGTPPHSAEWERENRSHTRYFPFVLFRCAKWKEIRRFFLLSISFKMKLIFYSPLVRFSWSRQNRRCRVSHSRSRAFVLTEWMWNVFFFFLYFFFSSKEKRTVRLFAACVSFPFSCSLQIIRISQHCMIAQTQNAFEIWCTKHTFN